MAKLTIKELEALATADIGKPIRDDGGLRGRVRANTKSKNGISVTFIYRYRWQGETADLPCGTWPADSMPTIRKVRDKARLQLDAGINPADQRKVEKLDEQKSIEAKLADAERQQTENLTVQDLFDAWVPDTERKDKGAELRRLFGCDVLPAIGAKSIKAVEERDMRKILDAVVERGSNRMAVMLLADLKQMFRWAEKRKPWKKLIEDNPVEHLEAKKITSDDYEGSERTRTLSEEEIKELAKKIPNAGLLKRTELALWIMLSTCCRIGEIIQARWEHVDLDAGVWIIPKENAKNKVAHTVYLPEFTLQYFLDLKALAGKSAWCFPRDDDKDHVCIKSTTKQIRDRQKRPGGKPMSNRSKKADALILSGADWVPHDLRRTGATMMQMLKIKPEVIERVLNHVEPNKLKRTYQTYDFEPEKREAWRLLGERLTLILNQPDNVITLPLQA